MHDITVSFPGGKRVDAHVGAFTVHTDQPVEHGGEGAAPAPFELFMVSMATCVGFFVNEFCTARGLDNTGLGVRLSAAWDAERKHYAKVSIDISLPPEFPDKYRKPILRTADLCSVKRHIIDPPEFELTLS